MIRRKLRDLDKVDAIIMDEKTYDDARKLLVKDDD